MGILLALIAGLALWIILWGVNLMNSFDGFMIGLMFPLLAATGSIIARYLPGSKD